MAKPSGCLKGGALGCGGLFLLGLLFVGGSLVGINSLANRAVNLRESLERDLPDQWSFTPRSDGTIPSDRLEPFLEVRRRLMSFCPEFTELAARMKGMDDHVRELEELESNDEATSEDLLAFLGRAGRIGGGMLGVGRRLGEFSVARNETLLAQEMGLGEYTWIYVIAYYSWLGQEPTDFTLGRAGHPRIFRDRVMDNVREMMSRQSLEMMGRQLIEMETGLAGSGGRAAGDTEAQLDRLRAELAAMDRDPLRLPFEDGLPMELRRSLEPFRTELESAYCAATSELDFMRTEKGRMGPDHL